jgi:hypothetical protein
VAALAGTLLATGCGERAVVVRDDGGTVLVEARLPESGRFALEYRHSYYRVPAREEFRAGRSGFRMVGVSSPSEAVLDYYAIAGDKRLGAWSTLAPARPERFAVGDRRYPLYGATPRHLTIAVEEGTWP